MADMRRIALALALLPASLGVSAQEDLSSYRDYTDNAQRDRPIQCKQGDIEDFPGQSLGQVFGADWPVQPEASSPEARTPVEIIKRGPIRWPRGLEPQNAFTVVAVLVDANGKPLRAEVICKSRMGFDKSARNSVLATTFAPAMIDGKPVTSVGVTVIAVKAMKHSSSLRPPRR